ncbi:unnamed protein product [Diatraea saccharalis]|uniref:Uncharacterized protein n=1 Tax=Diatraea saccharalis TaxID=40085 RepID=A0A9N9N3B3_9NEOP|nr:unnamed protein product [Diatraea saccharalis]
MVGYEKYDNISQTQKLLAGCFSGVLTRFITQPLDVVKVRQQLQPKIIVRCKKRMFSTTRKIFKEEGIKAFWQGYTLGQLQSICSVTCQFYVYELTTKQLEDSNVDSKYKPMLRFCCGTLAGAASASLAMPLEVGPAAGISFSVFRYMQPLILRFLGDCATDDCRHGPGNMYKPEHLLIASSVAGAVAGFVSKTLTYPFDLSHKEDRKYNTSSTSRNLIKCKSLISCLRDSYQSEGVKGLFRGWKITICKAQVTSVVAFTTYELACYAIREVDVR